MGRALTELKQEMLIAAQEGGTGSGLTGSHPKQDEDMEERRRKDKDLIQVIQHFSHFLEYNSWLIFSCH